jgi:hypothetical protein
MAIRWRFGIIAGMFLAVFSLYPQLKLVYMRGADWNGHYAYNDIDEVAYAGYLSALIDGRPRKNDPYTARDDSPESPQPESLFSIQFAAPYTIAIPARILGISAPWAMTLAGAFAAFFTALILFWLIRMMVPDDVFAMAGSLAVLAGGALFAGEGAVGEVFSNGFSYPYFPGFRRYIPAMAFPAFFLLIGLVWKILSYNERSRDANGGPLALLSIAAFGYTVFSYFYVWTTAAAWLVGVLTIWIVIRPDSFRLNLKYLAVVIAGSAASLAPYAYLLSQRSHTMDDVQLLVHTRALDLTRPPELIGFLVLFVLIAGVVIGLFDLKDKRVLFIASLAIVPAAVFNSQVITGRSLQPIHYQVFIGNYVAGLSLILALGLLWTRIKDELPRIAGVMAVLLAATSVVWGFVECHYTVRVLDEVNVIRDEAYPVGMRLREIAAAESETARQNILYIGIAEADDVSTLAPQPVLWARHQHVFAGITWDENKHRYYQLLHYQGVEADQLARSMKESGDYVSMIALFGWGRHTDRLSTDHKPLTFVEIDEEVDRYDQYRQSFNAASPNVERLGFLVVPVENSPELAELDRWYERSGAETHGKYRLYRLTLKPTE